jgi:hypothetical protein
MEWNIIQTRKNQQAKDTFIAEKESSRMAQHVATERNKTEFMGAEASIFSLSLTFIRFV